MALLESIDIPLNTTLPSFELPDPLGQTFQSQKLLGSKGLLIAFTCNHCPYAIAIWPRLVALAREAKKLGIETVGINPNIHPDYPADAPKEMVKKIKEWGIEFPYLVDATQKTAEAYKAQCTPDLYLVDSNFKLVYHGRLDDNWKEEAKVKKQELKEAIVALSKGETISGKQFPSMGCSIKWK